MQAMVFSPVRVHISPNFKGGDNTDGIYQYDITIMKFSSNGVNRLYATYIGGKGNEQPHSLIVDKAGNLVIAGRTSSPDYPSVRQPRERMC